MFYKNDNNNFLHLRVSSYRAKTGKNQEKKDLQYQSINHFSSNERLIMLNSWFLNCVKQAFAWVNKEHTLITCHEKKIYFDQIN